MSPRIGKVTIESILQAAEEIADAYGINEVTLASLAKKLEIRTPSLYNHVDGLPELQKRLAIYGMEQLHSALTQATIGVAGDAAVRALGEAYITFARKHPGLYEATFISHNLNDMEVEKAGAKIVDLSVRVLRTYGLDDETALHSTRGLRSIFHGFASLEQKGGFGLPLDVDMSFELLIDTYLVGLNCIKKKEEVKS